MTTVAPDDFSELVGEDLSGVTFVGDYLQLQFNPPPLLNAYTPVTVRSGAHTATFGEAAFANLLIAQIGKVVNLTMSSLVKPSGAVVAKLVKLRWPSLNTIGIVPGTLLEVTEGSGGTCLVDVSGSLP